MQRAIPFLLVMLATGCASSALRAPPPDGDAMCRALEPLTREHAVALANGDDDLSAITGARLIAGFAAACSLEFGA